MLYLTERRCNVKSNYNILIITVIIPMLQIQAIMEHRGPKVLSGRFCLALSTCSWIWNDKWL